MFASMIEIDTQLDSTGDFPPPNPTSPMTFGEILVGLTFNPSNDDKASKAKRLCADLADLLHDDFHNGDEVTNLKSMLFTKAVGDILDASMNSVKVLTLKY